MTKTKENPNETLPWPLDDERDLWADICYDNFFWFCDVALGYGRPDFAWWTPRVHRPFCDWYDAHIKEWEENRKTNKRTTKNLMVIVHREFGKTMIITKAGQLWLHLRNPDISTYIGSSTVTRAQLFFSPLKAILANQDPDSWFSWLYGDWYSPNRTWTSYELVHAARNNLARTEPSVGTWGVETGLVGMHPDCGFMDDPVDYEKMGTDSAWLGKVNTHMHSLAPVFKADSLFVYTGTRYHDADPIGENIRNAGVKTLTGMENPAIIPSETGKWHVYFRAAREVSGKPTYPENWPEERLKQYERANPLQYAAQLMNDPNTGHHVPLTAEQVDKCWVEERHVPKNLKISIHIDTAFKSKESVARGDDSVIQVWGHDRGTGDVYFLEGQGSNRWRIEEFNTQLVLILQKLRAKRQWPFVLTDEAEFGGKYGTWELTLQSWCHAVGLPSPVVVLLNRAGKKKVTRIIEAASYWVDGHVKLVKNAPGADKLIDQMLRIGTSSHDDWADCGADVFAKTIYQPVRRFGDRETPSYPSRPWDRELQDGDIAAREAYDNYFQSISEPEGGRGSID